MEELGQHRRTPCITYFAGYILPICRTICDCRFFRHIMDTSIQSSLIFTAASPSSRSTLCIYSSLDLHGESLAYLSAARIMKSPADLVYLAQLLPSRQHSWLSGRCRTEAENWLPHMTGVLDSFAYTPDRKSRFAARQILERSRFAFADSQPRICGPRASRLTCPVNIHCSPRRTAYIDQAIVKQPSVATSFGDEHTDIVVLSVILVPRHETHCIFPTSAWDFYPRTPANTAKEGRKRLASVTVKWLPDTKGVCGDI